MHINVLFFLFFRLRLYINNINSETKIEKVSPNLSVLYRKAVSGWGHLVTCQAQGGNTSTNTSAKRKTSQDIYSQR